jgi:hypothetical protein
MKPTIIYTYGPEGNCPVQAEGTIDGYPFYFRSRGGHWAIHVANDSSAGAIYRDDCWTLRELYTGVNADEPTPMYGHMVQFGAGWALQEECVAFIESAAIAWKAEKQMKSIS